MRWFSLTTNADHDLPGAVAGEISVAFAGTGQGILGYLDNDDAFVAYTDAEATMTDGDTTICSCGTDTKLQVRITGASATTAVGVAQLK